MLPARFVHFFDPDGSGKSTQVNLLVDYYLNRGIKVRKFWLRSPHTFAYLLWRFLVLIVFTVVLKMYSGFKSRFQLSKEATSSKSFGLL